MEHLTELGVGGIFCVLVLRQVLDFLAKREDARAIKTGTSTSRSGHHAIVPQVTAELVRQVRELHEWHSVTDDEGVKIWYVRKSLERSIKRLADSAEAQTQAVGRLVDLIERERARGASD